MGEKFHLEPHPFQWKQGRYSLVSNQPEGSYVFDLNAVVRGHENLKYLGEWRALRPLKPAVMFLQYSPFIFVRYLEQSD